MSSAAIARKRRSEPIQSSVSNMQYNPNDQNSTKPQTGLTLPQVIHVIDNRLISLESFMKDAKLSNQNIQKNNVSFENQPVLSNEIVEEFQNRFEILATEIADLKDIVLKLQSYTMDINKTLIEERIHIMSDIIEQPDLKIINTSETNDNVTINI